ncbi:helix-turn-helix domain-containing protein [Nocardia brevicatena]|uniref:helix-turn-helix domain-containing protein n=1 Tax=Nocardia brevicatena TaxID=37327 RepID=UPI001FE10BCF|nr:helix-turn-helix transcriptional regulator [Nocardia brevicatena]
MLLSGLITAWSAGAHEGKPGREADISDDGSTLARRQLGKYLRNGREECGLTLRQAADLIGRSSTLQRIEMGTVAARDRDLDALCKVYGFDAEHTAAMKGLAAQGNEQSWWHEYGDLIPANFDFYVGLEASAQHLTIYQSELVPGLLQIPSYAGALIHAVYPYDSATELERRLRLRMRRQTRITRKVRPAHLDVVLRESALRGVIGGPKVMASQLKYLADIGTRPNVTIRILPFGAGLPMGVAVGPFIILELGAEANGSSIDPPVVYVENFAGDLYLTKPNVVRRYHQAYQSICRQALDEVASRTLLRQMAKEYA